MHSPITGFKLLFNKSGEYTDVYPYASKIIFYKDPQSYAIVKIAAIFDLLTFSSYSATAILFAIFGFIGMWLFFLTFYEQYPALHRWLAIAAFFIPSVFFWGSGLLKDSITLGCLGLATYEIYRIFLLQKRKAIDVILLFIAFYGLYAIKVYILLTFLPSAILWVFFCYLHTVHSTVLKAMLFPFVLSTAVILGYYAMLKAGEDNERYALNSLANTARVTAYDIRYQTGRDAGSGYSLGELDGSFSSMVRLAPQAINVSLFRPYLWEVKNPFMLLSSLESLFLLGFSLYILAKQNVRIFNAIAQPDIFFALVFSISFAFAVGVSTYNFGTLVRYKIPLMPFFFVALVLTLHYSKSDKNAAEFEVTE
jgi:hypothetical protein